MAEAPASDRPLLGARRWRVVAVALLAVAGVAAFVAWRPVTVEAVHATPRALERTLLFTARVQTPARVEIGATVTGRVRSVEVREGDVVRAQAVLVRLEDDEARAAAAQAQAALRQAEAQLALQRRATAPGAEAQLAQSEAVATAAERDLQRTRELLAQRFVSPARLDDAQRVADVARAQLEAARAQAEAHHAAGPQTATARAQRDVADAALRTVQARLDQAVLRAPGPGRVLLRHVEPGQIVQPGKALLTLAVDGPTELVAPVDERFLGDLAVGQTARVLADAYPAQPFQARVASISPSVDAARGSVEVRLAPQAPAPAFLREDMTLSVEVVTGRRDQARVLPLRALRTIGADRGQALVDEGGRARLRELSLGLRTLDQVEITGGLETDDAVLLQPALAPDTRVRTRLVTAEQALRAAGATHETAGQALSSGFSR